MSNEKTIYLSGAFARREEILGYKKRIEAETGFRVIARWLTERKLSTSDAASTEKHLASAAQIDWEDLHASRIYARWSDPQYFSTESVTPSLLSGARLVEQGMAMERGMRCIVVAGKQCVFDRMADRVEHVADVDALIKLLKPEATHDA